MTELERHSYDVLVIGAGGAGLRAAIAAHESGARTAVVCKSLLGKAHTVMAEGGIAAAMGNLWPDDNWKVHFRDTMRGGKMLNNWRMAQLHAQEAPDRVQELEEYGALFDRTPDGLISQRDFGGHRYARLAHVGDRTGLEMIRTLQQRVVALGIDVYMECTITRLLTDGTGETAHGTNRGNIAGAFGYWRETGRFVCFEAPAVILATGGIGKSFKVTSNSWEYSGDGHALAARVGATLLNMEFIQFHPTGMVWPPSVRGILVTESVRGDGGILKNKDGKRFMFDYIPEFFKADTADTEAEADRWYEDKKNNRRPPELLPRDEVARAINAEVKAGRGSPAGGAFLDIASRRTPEYINKRLPSMYHQFKELADVDITKEPMEVGPTCHYIMGGVEVDADTQAAVVPGLYAAGEVGGGMHGANRLGGNSLGDLLVFGQRAGQFAAEYVASGNRPAIADGQIEVAAKEALAPFERENGENPYALHQELQATMNELVGIIRDADEMNEALRKLQEFKARARNLSVEGNRQFNPGWHLSIDLQNMLLCSEMVAVAAIERKESRGGHTRNDYPSADPEWGKRNIVLSEKDGTVSFKHQPLPVMPDDLKALLEDPPVTATVSSNPKAFQPGVDKAKSFTANFKVWRGDSSGGELKDYSVEVNEGEVVLDIIFRIQAEQANDMAVRWNCKAGKCGSCSAEINGKPRLMCMTRMSSLPPGETVVVTPLRTFPVIKDLATDVSFNYEKARQIPAFKPQPRDADGKYRMAQIDVDRGQEFRKCIECWMCQNVCHVIRDHEENKPSFSGPRFFIRLAELDMHPLDTNDRQAISQEQHGLGMCNITKCCTEVCPEHIKITDNGIIPLKERVADRKYDPLFQILGLSKKKRNG